MLRPGAAAPRGPDDAAACYVWSRLTPPPVVPPPRSGAASVVVQDQLYIFGGYGGGTGRLDDFWSYHFGRGTWAPVTVRSQIQPGCRENNGVVISDDSSRSIYLFGGYNGDCWLNDLWKYDIETQHWNCIQESSGPASDHDAVASAGQDAPHGAIPTRRFGYVSVVHNGKFVLFGGFDVRAADRL
jgi:leucine-zipper-like transcriptional regulator 1